METEVKVIISGLELSSKFYNTIVLIWRLGHQNGNMIMLLWHSRHLFQQRASWSKGWHECSNWACQWICPSTLTCSPCAFLQYTTKNVPFNILGGQPRGKFLSEFPFRHNCVWSGRQLHFLLPNQPFTTQNKKLGIPLLISQENKTQLTPGA